MPRFSLNQILFFLLFAAIFALACAYISQFIFGHQPCILCLYQRQPFFGIIALTFLALTFFRSEKFQKIAFFLCLILLLINSAIAFYHVGVEQKIFKTFTTCSSPNLENVQTIEELEKILIATKSIRCDQPSFVFLGFSMAAWNFFYCLFLFLSGLLVFNQGYRHLTKKFCLKLCQKIHRK